MCIENSFIRVSDLRERTERFLRYAARDAVKHPAFSREGWKQIAASEHDLRSGDAELVSRAEVVEMLNQDDHEH